MSNWKRRFIELGRQGPDLPSRTNDQDETLDRLQTHLERLGAPIVRHLRPGVPSDDASPGSAPPGLPLPDQAARWFAWHDGVAQHEPSLAPHSLVTWELLGLGAAIDDYQHCLGLPGKAEPPNPHPTVEAWDTRWFSLARDSSGRPSWSSATANVTERSISSSTRIRT